MLADNIPATFDPNLDTYPHILSTTSLNDAGQSDKQSHSYSASDYVNYYNRGHSTNNVEINLVVAGPG